VHFLAKNLDLTDLQDRLGAALQNCGKAQGFCKIAARLRAPPNCQALYSCSTDGRRAIVGGPLSLERNGVWGTLGAATELGARARTGGSRAGCCGSRTQQQWWSSGAKGVARVVID